MGLTQPPQVQNSIFIPSVVIIVEDLQGGAPGSKGAATQSLAAPGPKQLFLRSSASSDGLFKMYSSLAIC